MFVARRHCSLQLCHTGGHHKQCWTACPHHRSSVQTNMWWSMSAGMSGQIYQKYFNGEDVVYTWDWGASRPGSFAPAGEQTSINRYMIDFQTWEQVNTDNGRRHQCVLSFFMEERRTRNGTVRSMGSSSAGQHYSY